MTDFVQGQHHIWNHFDDLGLLIGLNRKIGETNHEFRDRILDAFAHIRNSTHQGMTNAIARDLGDHTYNVVDKRYFVLTNTPRIDQSVQATVDSVVARPQLIETFPLPSGWVLPVGVTQDAIASGGVVYDLGPDDGWILWRDDRGQYTRILEFIQAPATDAPVQIEYSFDVDGHTHRYTDKDFQRLEDDPIYGLEGRFTGYNAVSPTSGQVQVNALSDPTYKLDLNNQLIDSKGRATELLVAIANRINEAAPILWGDFKWDETFWDSADKELTGQEALPVLMDAAASGFVHGALR